MVRNAAVSTPRNFMFRDNIAPTIDSLDIVNGTSPSGEIATVTAQASDTGGSGVLSATLTYSNTSGDFNVAMTNTTGDWVGEIPNHAPGTIVSYYVTVFDVDGNSIQSTPDTFTFFLGATPDTLGPSITLIAHAPTSPTPTDTVTVSSDILDVSGVGSAVLQYRIESGAWNNVTMTNVGDTYSGTIPAQADGTTVTYRIVAYDGIGNEAVSVENFYTVAEEVTTPTTTTTPPPTTTTPGPTPPGPGPINEEMMMIYGAFGALVLIVVLLAIKRRK